MADITTGDGSKITKDAIHFRRASQPDSKFDWPNEFPRQRDINKWKKALRCISSEPYSFDFIDRLGSWIEEPHLQWEWFYCPSTRRVLRQSHLDWEQHEPILVRATLQTFRRAEDLTDLQVDFTDLQHTTIRWEQGRLHFEGAAPINCILPPAPQTLRDFINAWGQAWPLARRTRGISAGGAQFYSGTILLPFALFLSHFAT